MNKSRTSQFEPEEIADHHHSQAQASKNSSLVRPSKEPSLNSEAVNRSFRVSQAASDQMKRTQKTDTDDQGDESIETRLRMLGDLPSSTSEDTSGSKQREGLQSSLRNAIQTVRVQYPDGVSSSCDSQIQIQSMVLDSKQAAAVQEEGCATEVEMVGGHDVDKAREPQANFPAYYQDRYYDDDSYLEQIKEEQQEMTTEGSKKQEGDPSVPGGEAFGHSESFHRPPVNKDLDFQIKQNQARCQRQVEELKALMSSTQNHLKNCYFEQEEEELAQSAETDRYSQTYENGGLPASTSNGHLLPYMKEHTEGMQDEEYPPLAAAAGSVERGKGLNPVGSGTYLGGHVGQTFTTTHLSFNLSSTQGGRGEEQYSSGLKKFYFQQSQTLLDKSSQSEGEPRDYTQVINACQPYEQVVDQEEKTQKMHPQLVNKSPAGPPQQLPNTKQNSEESDPPGSSSKQSPAFLKDPKTGGVYQYQSFRSRVSHSSNKPGGESSDKPAENTSAMASTFLRPNYDLEEMMGDCSQPLPPEGVNQIVSFQNSLSEMKKPVDNQAMDSIQSMKSLKSKISFASKRSSRQSRHFDQDRSKEQNSRDYLNSEIDEDNFRDGPIESVPTQQEPSPETSHRDQLRKIQLMRQHSRKEARQSPSAMPANLKVLDPRQHKKRNASRLLGQMEKADQTQYLSFGGHQIQPGSFDNGGRATAPLPEEEEGEQPVSQQVSQMVENPKSQNATQNEVSFLKNNCFPLRQIELGQSAFLKHDTSIFSKRFQESSLEESQVLNPHSPLEVENSLPQSAEHLKSSLPASLKAKRKDSRRLRSSAAWGLTMDARAAQPPKQEGRGYDSATEPGRTENNSLKDPLDRSGAEGKIDIDEQFDLLQQFRQEEALAKEEMERELRVPEALLGCQKSLPNNDLQVVSSPEEIRSCHFKKNSTSRSDQSSKLREVIEEIRKTQLTFLEKGFLKADDEKMLVEIQKYDSTTEEEILPPLRISNKNQAEDQAHRTSTSPLLLEIFFELAAQHQWLSKNLIQMDGQLAQASRRIGEAEQLSFEAAKHKEDAAWFKAKAEEEAKKHDLALENHRLEKVNLYNQTSLYSESLQKSEKIIKSLKVENEYLKKQQDVLKEQLERYMDKQSTLNKTFELNNTQMLNTQKEISLKDLKLGEQADLIAKQAKCLSSAEKQIKKVSEELEKERRRFDQELKDRETVEVQNMLLRRIEAMVTQGQTVNTQLVNHWHQQRSLASSACQNRAANEKERSSSFEGRKQIGNKNRGSGLTQYSAILPSSLQSKTLGINSFAQQLEDEKKDRQSLVSGEYSMTMDLRRDPNLQTAGGLTLSKSSSSKPNGRDKTRNDEPELNLLINEAPLSNSLCLLTQSDGICQCDKCTKKHDNNASRMSVHPSSNLPPEASFLSLETTKLEINLYNSFFKKQKAAVHQDPDDEGDPELRAIEMNLKKQIQRASKPSGRQQKRSRSSNHSFGQKHKNIISQYQPKVPKHLQTLLFGPDETFEDVAPAQQSDILARHMNLVRESDSILESQKAREKELKAKIKTLAKEAEETAERQSAVIAELEASKAALQEEITKLKEEATAHSEREKQLLEEKETVLKEKEQAFIQLKGELEQLEKEFDRRMKDLETAKQEVRDKVDENKELQAGNEEFQNAIINELYSLNEIIVKKRKHRSKVKSKENQRKQQEKENLLIELLTALQANLNSPKNSMVVPNQQTKSVLQKIDSEEPSIQIISYDQSNVNSNHPSHLLRSTNDNSDMLILQGPSSSSRPSTLVQRPPYNGQPLHTDEGYLHQQTESLAVDNFADNYAEIDPTQYTQHTHQFTNLNQSHMHSVPSSQLQPNQPNLQNVRETGRFVQNSPRGSQYYHQVASPEPTSQDPRQDLPMDMMMADARTEPRTDQWQDSRQDHFHQDFRQDPWQETRADPRQDLWVQDPPRQDLSHLEQHQGPSRKQDPRGRSQQLRLVYHYPQQASPLLSRTLPVKQRSATFTSPINTTMFNFPPQDQAVNHPSYGGGGGRGRSGPNHFP